MSEENETIEDIEKKLRELARAIKHTLQMPQAMYERHATIENKPLDVYFTELADRIKAAWKRETEKISLHGAEDKQKGKTMKYIRVNHVDAEPMAFGEFKEKFPKSGGANVERDPADEGYVITYRKGRPNEYVSWCPKAEFEAVSRPVDGMTFGMAIEAMKRGKKVARRGWNGKGMWLCVPLCDGAKEIPANDILDNPLAVFLGKPNAVHAYHTGGTAKVVPYITMKAADGTFVTGWLASQTDMLSEDWMIVE